MENAWRRIHSVLTGHKKVVLAGMVGVIVVLVGVVVVLIFSGNGGSVDKSDGDASTSTEVPARKGEL